MKSVCIRDNSQKYLKENSFGNCPRFLYERILVNHADPRTEVDGAFSEPTTQHPIFSDQRIRKALDLGDDT